MKLEGKVVGPWVDECHRVWQATLAELGTKRIRLDLRGVLFLDDRGTNLLREIHRTAGEEVVADSPLTKYFAEQIKGEIETGGNKGD